jgi:hypothetical protein
MFVLREYVQTCRVASADLSGGRIRCIILPSLGLQRSVGCRVTAVDSCPQHLASRYARLPPKGVRTLSFLATQPPLVWVVRRSPGDFSSRKSSSPHDRKPTRHQKCHRGRRRVNRSRSRLLSLAARTCLVRPARPVTAPLMGHMTPPPHSILFGGFYFGETTERTVLGGMFSAGVHPPPVVIIASNGNCYAD